MQFQDNYLEILKLISKNGTKKTNRTGIKTYSLFNKTLEMDVEGYEKMPIINLRKIYTKGAIIETLWLMGIHMKDSRYNKLPITNTKYLTDNKVNYWKPWQDKNGNLGPVYGSQFCSMIDYEKYYMGKLKSDNKEYKINQFQNLINTLRTDPDSRRLIVTAWNPIDLPKMALPPCHHTMEFYSRPVIENGKEVRYLDLRLIQRSADVPIGVPYNMIMYTIIDKIISLCTNHIPGRVYLMLGDAHIYENQMDGVNEMIKRHDNGLTNNLKRGKLNLSQRIMNIKNERMLELEDFYLDGSDFIISDYESLEKIDMPVAV